MCRRDGGVVVLEVVATVLAGMGIGLSLGAPPGPVNAVIASHTVTRSWRAGFLVGVGATTADTIFLAITILARSRRRGRRALRPLRRPPGRGRDGLFRMEHGKGLEAGRCDR